MPQRYEKRGPLNAERLRSDLAYLNLAKRDEVVIADILRDAREGVADPSRWCIGMMAMDEQGCATEVVHSRAVRWCTVGHLQHSFLSKHMYGAPMSVLDSGRAKPVNHAQLLLDQIALQIWGAYITQVNDQIGQAAALEVIDAAIAFAQGEL